MNRRLLLPVLIVVSLSFIASQSYACNPRPTPVIGPYDNFVCVGEEVHLYGGYPDYSHDNDEEGYCITEYDWYFPGADAVTGGNTASPTARWDSAGTYEVRLWVKDNEGQWCDAPDTFLVYVVKVDKVVEWVSGPENTGPLYINLENIVYLEAIPYPTSAFPEGEPHWEIVEPWPEGSEPSLYVFGYGLLARLYNLTVPGDYIVRAKCGDDDDGDIITVTVVTVEGLTWVTYPDDVVADPDHGPNITLSDCPKNPGKRIFPGKKCYEDSTEPLEHNETKMRQKVKIRATLSAAPDRDYVVYVIFKRWDVDDPSSSTPPIDEHDDDPDPNKHSIDNRGSYYFFHLEEPKQWTYAWAESNSNVVDANFYVSYQPGDNYRITATTRIVTKHNGITHYMVETGSLPSTVKRSDMLTTWRKLWIERDSMDDVATTGAEKDLTSSTITSLDENSYDSGITTLNVDDLYDYWDGADRLNGGKLAVGGHEYPIVDMYDTSFDETLDVQGNPYGDGVRVNDDCDLYDDDYEGNGVFKIDFPIRTSLAAIDKLMFQKAYIEPENLPSAYEDTVSFKLNFDSIGSLTPDVTGSSSFWTVMVMNAFQPQAGNDEDPDSETGTAGLSIVSLVFDNPDKCAIYHETGREMGMTMSHYMAHEIGHTQNIGNQFFGHCSNAGCVMQDGAAGYDFCDDCKKALRERSTW